MNKINRKLEYALISLKYMSEKNQGALTTVKEICQGYDCPFDATSRVLQQLAKAQILKSEQGARGGYLLMKDLRKVSLFELIEVVIGPMGVAKCVSGVTPCDLSPKCNIAGPVHFLNQQLIEFYRAIKLSDLLNSSPRHFEETWEQKLSDQPPQIATAEEVSAGEGL